MFFSLRYNDVILVQYELVTAPGWIMFVLFSGASSSKQNAKLSELEDECRLIFVFLSGRFQNLFERKRDFGV